MLEFVLVASILLLTVVLISRAAGPRWRGSAVARGWLARLAALSVVVAVARAAIWYAHSFDAHSQATHLQSQAPHANREDGYVSSSACQSCHPGHFASWHSTYHRTMTQLAASPAVVGDFANHRVSYDGVDYELFRRGQGYWARLTPQGAGPDRAAEVQLVMTTGSHHYQVYWTGEGEDRSLIEFPLAWLIDDKRWVPREAALVMPPHLKQQAVLWNGVCIRCHSTHSQPRIEMGSQLADTSATELGISCEACHGPAEAHIRANQNPARRYSQHLAGDKPDETIINPARLSAERSSQVCGSCHAIASFGQQDWQRGHWNAFRPGQDLEATRHVIRPTRPESLVDLRGALEQNPDYLIGHYWRDGMVRVSGREYNGLVESPCYQGGKLSCLSCHSMHASDPDDQLAAGMASDRACLQCHENFQDKIAEHSHHAADSAGSRCYNCHMPHTNYGLLKAIRSHQVSSPDVAVSLKTGRPNACNQCHLDQSLAWTEKQLAAWYGEHLKASTPGTEGETAAGKTPPAIPLAEREDYELSAMAVMLLRGDAGQRALAAWSMGWPAAHMASGNKWQAPYLAQLLEDPYPAVRYIALRSLKRLPGFEEFSADFVGPEDERREAHRRALAMWENSSGTRLDQTGAPILIDTAGTLDRESFERLLKLRDDRDIDIKE